MNTPTSESWRNAGGLPEDVEETILDDRVEPGVADLFQVEMIRLMDTSHYCLREQIEFFCITLFRNVIYIYYIC